MAIKTRYSGIATLRNPRPGHAISVHCAQEMMRCSVFGFGVLFTDLVSQNPFLVGVANVLDWTVWWP
eukprot:3938197-Rhodomonas_salina.4